MVLPGRLAKGARLGFADIIKRYYAGDMSLMGEIEANAKSDSPIPRLARAAMSSGSDKEVREAKRMRFLEANSILVNDFNTEVSAANSFISLMSSVDAGWTSNNDRRANVLGLFDNIMLKHSNASQELTTPRLSKKPTEDAMQAPVELLSVYAAPVPVGAAAIASFVEVVAAPVNVPVIDALVEVSVAPVNVPVIDALVEVSVAPVDAPAIASCMEVVAAPVDVSVIAALVEVSVAPVNTPVIASFVEVLAAPVVESPQATSKKAHPNQARDTAVCDFIKKLFAEAFEEKDGHYVAFGDIYDVFVKSKGVVAEKEDRQFRFYCKALFMAQWPAAVYCVHQKRRSYRNIAVKAN